MEWAMHSNQNPTMLLLDFEKSYDRVEWSFLRMTLEAFGFPQIFCSIVVMLLKDASRVILRNDHSTLS